MSKITSRPGPQRTIVFIVIFSFSSILEKLQFLNSSILEITPYYIYACEG